MLKKLSNPKLLMEYRYFNSIKKDSNHPNRVDYIHEIRENFNVGLEDNTQLNDTSGNGQIDYNEFQTLIEGYLYLIGVKHTKKKTFEMFKHIDKNDDGVIEFSEFLTFADEVNDNEILGRIIKELKNRGLYQKRVIN